MNLTYPTCAILIYLTLASCSRRDEKSPQLIEANRLHLEAMKISGELEQKLETLATTAKGNAEKMQIDSLKNLIGIWEENVIEVPGFVHAHDHAHGGHIHGAHSHDTHSHKAAPAMTDESMLDYQRQSQEAIFELKAAIEKLDSLQK